jgi:hypothetical protein
MSSRVLTDCDYLIQPACLFESGQRAERMETVWQEFAGEVSRFFERRLDIGLSPDPAWIRVQDVNRDLGAASGRRALMRRPGSP